MTPQERAQRAVDSDSCVCLGPTEPAPERCPEPCSLHHDVCLHCGEYVDGCVLRPDYDPYVRVKASELLNPRIIAYSLEAPTETRRPYRRIRVLSTEYGWVVTTEHNPGILTLNNNLDWTAGKEYCSEQEALDRARRYCT